MRIGIFAGTFSPVHNGHIAAAHAFMEKMWLDVLYVMPTALPPHKQLHGDAAAADRLEMLRLAFAGMDGVIVSDMEIRRGGRSYTVDTLRQMHADLHGDDRLFLLMGTDMLLSFDSWREPDEIFRLCWPVYIRREADAALDGEIIRRIARYRAEYGKTVCRVDAPALEVSSTEIRQAVAAGRSIDDMVPPAVAAYIREKNLYREGDGTHGNDSGRGE